MATVVHELYSSADSRCRVPLHDRYTAHTQTTVDGSNLQHTENGVLSIVICDEQYSLTSPVVAHFIAARHDSACRWLVPYQTCRKLDGRVWLGGAGVHVLRKREHSCR